MFFVHLYFNEKTHLTVAENISDLIVKFLNRYAKSRLASKVVSLVLLYLSCGFFFNLQKFKNLKDLKMSEKPILRVAVTGAAGQIAYSLLYQISSGYVFGEDQVIELYNYYVFLGIFCNYPILKMYP